MTPEDKAWHKIMCPIIWRFDRTNRFKAVPCHGIYLNARRERMGRGYFWSVSAPGQIWHGYARSFEHAKRNAEDTFYRRYWHAR